MKEFLYFLKQWPGAIISFFAQKGGGGVDNSREVIINFEVVLTGSRALNILFYFHIKSKNNHIK